MNHARRRLGGNKVGCGIKVFPFVTGDQTGAISSTRKFIGILTSRGASHLLKIRVVNPGTKRLVTRTILKVRCNTSDRSVTHAYRTRPALDRTIGRTYLTTRNLGGTVGT